MIGSESDRERWAYNRRRWVARCIRGWWSMPTGGSWPTWRWAAGWCARCAWHGRMRPRGQGGATSPASWCFPARWCRAAPACRWPGAAAARPPGRGGCPATTVGVPVASLSAPAAPPGHAEPVAGGALAVDAVPIPLLRGVEPELEVVPEAVFGQGCAAFAVDDRILAEPGWDGDLVRVTGHCGATLAGGAFEYLDRDRTAGGRTQQPEHDLQGAALAVAAVAAARQRAAVSLEVTGSQVVQHKRVVTQMAPRQALFDTPGLGSVVWSIVVTNPIKLAPYQPVHRCVELILVDRLQPQDLAEGGDSALRVQGASGGQFGAGVDDAGDNHGDDEVAPATGRTSDEGMQAELLEGAEDGGDMAVRVAAQAGEGGLGIDQGFAFESSADKIDDVVGEVGDVAEGFMLDLAVVAEGSAQQMGTVGGVFVMAGGGGYVDGAISGRYRHKYNANRHKCQDLPL